MIVNQWKQNENASVAESVLLRFCRDENGEFNWRITSSETTASWDDAIFAG